MALTGVIPRENIRNIFLTFPAITTVVYMYSKTCVKRPLKDRQIKILMTNGSLMKIEIIADLH